MKLVVYFSGPMPVLIWIAGLIELIRLSPLNLCFLLILQLVNGLVWLISDTISNEALKIIKKSLAPKGQVKRDGQWTVISTSELVVGDKIQISEGDFLPADCKLGPGECTIDQSMLTGETYSITKTEGAKVYMGSICKKGKIEATVTATGINTFFGKTNLLSSEVNQKGRIEKILARVTFLLIVVVSVLVTVILIVFLVKGNEFLGSLSTSFMLMVLSLPIAMQAVCATTLAFGAKGLDKKNAVVCRLASIEELASMQILCLHKAGIFTKDEPNISNSVLFYYKTIEELFLTAFLASRRDMKNPVDRCICEYAVETCKVEYECYEEEDFAGYDPKLKRSEAIVRNTLTGDLMKCCKGAPQVVLAMTNELAIEEEVSRTVNLFASQGYSSIAVASTDKEGTWHFGGIIAIYDPFCEGTLENIKSLKNLNIKIIFLTGEQISVAKQISASLQLGDVIFNAEILNSDMTTVQREIIDSVLLLTDGFAEVYPEHKFTIVKMLQNKKKRVGITGVSINDAGALKRANVGLAGFEATDAAKLAAEIIFKQPGLQVIASAISKSRKIFMRSKIYCEYRLSCSFQLLAFFFVSVVSINPKADFVCYGSDSCENIPNTSGLPIIALIIIALLNDFTIISISHDRADGSLQPCKWALMKNFIISCTLGAFSFFSSLAFLLLSLSNMDSRNPNSIFHYFGIPTFSYDEVLTGTLLKVSLSSYMTIFSIRTERWFFLSLPGKALAFAGISSMVVSTLISKYWYLNFQPKNSVIIATLSSISWSFILFVWILVIAVFLLQDVSKILIYKAYSIYPPPGPDAILSKMCLEETLKNYYKKDSTKILTERSNFSAKIKLVNEI